MTSQEKIDLINTLHHKVIDWSCSGNECEYVVVPLDNETREVLYKLGYNEEWIKENNFAEENEFDLVQVGFEFADWWSSKNGFSI